MFNAFLEIENFSKMPSCELQDTFSQKWGTCLWANQWISPWVYNEMQLTQFFFLQGEVLRLSRRCRERIPLPITNLFWKGRKVLIDFVLLLTPCGELFLCWATVFMDATGNLCALCHAIFKNIFLTELVYYLTSFCNWHIFVASSQTFFISSSRLFDIDAALWRNQCVVILSKCSFLTREMKPLMEPTIDGAPYSVQKPTRFPQDGFFVFRYEDKTWNTSWLLCVSYSSKKKFSAVSSSFTNLISVIV